MLESPFRVLIADQIADEGRRLLEEAGCLVEVRVGASEDELAALIPFYQAMLVRSGTQVTRRLLAAGTNLRIVGRCGVGVDNIDVEAATEYGILVVNSPGGNAVAAAEHTMALLLAMARRIPDSVQSLRARRWERKQFVGIELNGKTLGIVGLGRIGSEVARRALAFQMRLLAYDPWVNPDRARQLNAELVPLETLLREADVVTLHVPGNRETEGLINAERLALLKPSALLINCARAEVVDEAALLQALRDGRLAGAAIDVWAEEPLSDSPLLDLPQVVPTPHLGASTREAQIKVAVDVAEQVLTALRGGLPRSPVNLRTLTPARLEGLRPYLDLARKLGMLLLQISNGPIRRVELSYYGDNLQEDTQPVTRAFLQGLLQSTVEIPINLVNAEYVARQRGIDVAEMVSAERGAYTNQVRAVVHAGLEPHSATGTVLDEGELRIVELDQFEILVEPKGYVLLSYNTDRPGAIGWIGTVLGNAGINIANMRLGRMQRGGKAIAVLNVDDAVPEGVLREIETGPQIISARLIDFGSEA